MSTSPNELSFLPDDYLENKSQRRANIICAALFLVTIVSIGVAFTTSERSLQVVEKQHAKVDAEFTEAAKHIQQVQQMQEKQRQMAHQAELTAALLEKVPRSVLLARITNALPARVSLLDLSLESKKRSNGSHASAPKTAFEIKKAQNKAESGPTEPEVTQYDVTLHITGLAPTDVEVAELIRKLNSIHIFKDVNLVVSEWDKESSKDQKQGVTDASWRKFQIEMSIDANADLQDDAGSAPVASDSNPPARPVVTAAVDESR